MDENVLTGLALDEPKALAGIEPLHCTLFFTHCFTLFRAAERPHNIKLSDASSPEPLNRAAAVFKPRPAGPQSGPQNKKIGRKCDLATALQPKGDTRATNANTEYHIALLFPNTFFGLVTPLSFSAWDAFSWLRVAGLNGTGGGALRGRGGPSAPACLRGRRPSPASSRR